MNTSEINKEEMLKKFTVLPKGRYPFQFLGIALEKKYGKKIWMSFKLPYATEFKIEKADEITEKNGKSGNFSYFIGVLRKLK